MEMVSDGVCVCAYECRSTCWKTPLKKLEVRLDWRTTTASRNYPCIPRMSDVASSTERN